MSHFLKWKHCQFPLQWTSAIQTNREMLIGSRGNRHQNIAVTRYHLLRQRINQAYPEAVLYPGQILKKRKIIQFDNLSGA